MGMAHLPSKPKSEHPVKLSRLEQAIAAESAAGLTPGQIAKKAYPTDKKKRKALRQKIRQLAYTSEAFVGEIHKRVQAELALGLGSAAAGLRERAEQTGRPDAVRLLFEASQFHNPKVQHEHSGDVELKLTIPRPPVDEAGQPPKDSNAIEGTATEVE